MRTRHLFVAAVAIGALGLLTWSSSLAGPEAAQSADYESGAYLYKTYCASCHGSDGRGDGPVADLSPTRPTDLTLLAMGRGGTFPRAHVIAVLRGTTAVAGHSGPGMPNWNEVLRRAARGNEDTVNRQIDALVSHIESLQSKGR